MLTDRVKQTGSCVASSPCSFHFHPFETLGNDVQESHSSWRDHVDKEHPLPWVIAVIALKHHMTKTILDHPAPSPAEPSEGVNSRSDYRWDQKNNPLHTAESGKKKKNGSCAADIMYGSFYVFGLYEHNGKKSLSCQGTKEMVDWVTVGCLLHISLLYKSFCCCCC